MKQKTHTISFEGITLNVSGYYDKPDNTTGYKGGWSSETIKVNDTDIYWMLKPSVINLINAVIVEQNY